MLEPARAADTTALCQSLRDRLHAELRTAADATGVTWTETDGLCAVSRGCFYTVMIGVRALYKKQIRHYVVRVMGHRLTANKARSVDISVGLGPDGDHVAACYSDSETERTVFRGTHDECVAWFRERFLTPGKVITVRQAYLLQISMIESELLAERNVDA